jgi:glycosyltransferase involved in cell wall biosynthesis
MSTPDLDVARALEHRQDPVSASLQPAKSDARDGVASLISIVIPIFNERESLIELLESLTDVVLCLKQPFEIIFVDDGSNDGSDLLLEGFAAKEDSIKVIRLRRNYGQTAALMAGIDFAQGDVIIPMDGDGQNDPADIPRLLDKMAEGYDVVSGWRRDRKDKRIRRVLLSRIANRLISRVTGVSLHDYGCSLKAYRTELLSGIRLYGEMHRFIPIYASWQGARVAEIPVTHHARRAGESKYGLERIFKVVLDLMVIAFLGRYETKPIYVFGGFGLVAWAAAGVASAYAFYLKYFESTSLIQTPLPVVAAIFFNAGMMSILMGFLAELLMRTYFESQHKRPYAIAQTHNIQTADPDRGTAG